MELHPQLAAAGYKSAIRLPVLWGDQDAFGHVNNTVPIRWFESARIAYLEHSGMDKLLDDMQLGPILASIHCDYRRQLRYPDTVSIGARITRIGRSGLTMVHAVYSDAWGDQVAVEGESVVVVFDYRANQPRRIPDEMRALINRWEAPNGPSS